MLLTALYWDLVIELLVIWIPVFVSLMVAKWCTSLSLLSIQVIRVQNYYCLNYFLYGHLQYHTKFKNSPQAIWDKPFTFNPTMTFRNTNIWTFIAQSCNKVSLKTNNSLDQFLLGILWRHQWYNIASFNLQISYRETRQKHVIINVIGWVQARLHTNTIYSCNVPYAI